MITIEGTLIADATPCTNGTRTAVIGLTVHAGPGTPFDIWHVVGDTPEAHAEALRLSQRMRRGAAVTVTCDALTQRTDHSHRAFVVRAVRSLRVDGVVLA